MRKTLHIHIGHYKTGTTALQVFLKRNRVLLARHGLDYAETFLHQAKHSVLAFSVLRACDVTSLMFGYDRPDRPEALWGALFDHVRQSRQPSVLVSSEAFMRFGAHPRCGAMLPRLAALAPDIDIRVIAYLREPQSHLRSWYNQLVKMNVPVPGFNEAVADVMEPIHYDYALALRPWIGAFGAERVTVRPYSAALREGDMLYRDFLSAVGMAMPGDAAIPAADLNPRLRDEVVDLVRRARSAGAPPRMCKALRDRAAAFLDAAQAPAPDASAARFAAVAERARAGLEALAALPGCSVDPARLAAHLPAPEHPRDPGQARMLDFILSEWVELRRGKPDTPPPDAPEGPRQALRRGAGRGRKVPV